jgi:hypothetical protein
MFRNIIFVLMYHRHKIFDLIYTQFYSDDLKKKDYLVALDINGRIILKWVLKNHMIQLWELVNEIVNFLTP